MKRVTRYFSPITLRIFGMNAGTLLILAFGLLYTGKYEGELIKASKNSLLAQGRLLSIALNGNGGNNRALLDKLADSNALHIIVFDKRGNLLLDSGAINDTGKTPDDVKAPRPSSAKSRLESILHQAANLASVRIDLPAYPAGTASHGSSYPGVLAAMQGAESAGAWYDDQNHLLLTAALPSENAKGGTGAIFVMRPGQRIEDAVHDIRMTVLKLFACALLSTLALSIYLTESIGVPLRRLSEAAQKVEQSLMLKDSIPDYSTRRDEIGDLSASLRNMTEALAERIDAIGNFSADVAHEIKNPLASLKSAIETFSVVKDPERQQKLIAIIEADIERIDRLITDISAASRLDAEISRAEKSAVDLAPLLKDAVRTAAENLNLDGRLTLDIEKRKPLIVNGNAAQITQVINNLIQNASSFLSPEGKIDIACLRQKDQVLIHVDNDGPHIPNAKIETIFERFYTERPESERFGLHSGLGLSISRQIIRSHKGAIFARNLSSARGEPRGVRFTIILPVEAAT